MKTLSTTLATLALTLLGACGSTNPGLLHTVPEKALVGLSPEQTLAIEAARAEVQKAKEVSDAGGLDVKVQEKDVSALDDRHDSAADAVDAAAEAIEATDDKQAGELRAAAAKRDQLIAEAKKRYTDESGAIRDRYAKLQAQNRAGLATAKQTQEVVAAQAALEAAELAEAKARAEVAKQDVMVKKAALELAKLIAVQEVGGVMGAKETADRQAFQAQLDGEQKKLAALQAKLDAQAKTTALARGKLEQLKARAPGQ